MVHGSLGPKCSGNTGCFGFGLIDYRCPYLKFGLKLVTIHFQNKSGLRYLSEKMLKGGVLLSNQRGNICMCFLARLLV